MKERRKWERKTKERTIQDVRGRPIDRHWQALVGIGSLIGRWLAVAGRPSFGAPDEGSITC